MLIPTTALATDTLVGAGDIAECNVRSERTAQIVEQVIADRPRSVVFTAGDNAYNTGSVSDFAACYDPTWGRFRDRTRPAPGNHDYRTPGADPYYDYFGANAGPYGRGYYAYDLGDWRIYALNSNGAGVNAISIEQVEWLRTDLSANPRQCALAYWHHARWSSGLHGSHTTVDALWDTLYDAGADLVISGHDHDYERFGRLDAHGQRDVRYGMRQIVVGTGGGGTRDFGAVQPHSRVRITGTEGVLQLDLSASGYVGHFLTPAGQQDSFDATCHGVPSAPPVSALASVPPLAVFGLTSLLLFRLSHRRARHWTTTHLNNGWPS